MAALVSRWRAVLSRGAGASTKRQLWRRRLDKPWNLQTRVITNRAALAAHESSTKGTDDQTGGDTFADLLRNSKLVRIEDPVGKKLEAEIIAVSGKNLYVDFGHKFHAVVPTPDEDPQRYRKGTRVVVKVKDLEQTCHFLGEGRNTSLLEAEAELISTYNPPA